MKKKENKNREKRSQHTSPGHDGRLITTRQYRIDTKGSLKLSCVESVLNQPGDEKKENKEYAEYAQISCSAAGNTRREDLVHNPFYLIASGRAVMMIDGCG